MRTLVLLAAISQALALPNGIPHMIMRRALGQRVSESWGNFPWSETHWSKEPHLDWSQIRGIDVQVPVLANATRNENTQGRIVNGTEAKPNSAPYQVGLIIHQSGGTGFCGGSLISRSYVLTAAHCTRSASLVQVIFGAHRVQETEETQVVVSSTNIAVHPDYGIITIRNDISVIRLPSPVTLNRNIEIIRLASANAGNFADLTARLTGWGRVSDAISTISPSLQEVFLPVISNSQCTDTFGILLIRDSTICTSGKNGKGACNGDSGGPLVVGDFQVGIVSFGSSEGCAAGFPTAYGRVSSFRTWIAENSDVAVD